MKNEKPSKKKDHQVGSGKNQKNIVPLNTFHLPSSAMTSLLVSVYDEF